MSVTDESVRRLTRDLIEGAGLLGQSEARFLVDEYYAMQKQRIRSTNQVRALSETSEPHEILQWFNTQSETLENQVKRALNAYAEAHPVGQWMLSITGIGPVISAGLLAHIDITQCPTVGHIWSYAGLNPTAVWERGQKRPWNGSLKTLCWKIGESFVKVSNKDDDIYGKFYKQRREFEHANNERLAYKELADTMIARNPRHKQAETYRAGKLPDSHIYSRAKRYAVKLFLAHLHEVWYKHHFGKEPPLPYAISHLGHAHKINPPTLVMESRS
jgi:hypothetical protein